MYLMELEFNNKLLVRIHPDCPNKDPIAMPAKPGDVGYDLKAWIETTDQMFVIEPYSMSNIRTGVFFKLPKGYWGDIRPRSSTFSKRKLMVMHGTIDEGYIGEISIFLFNPMPEPHIVMNGDRLAQVVIMNSNVPNIKFIDVLPDTDRGSTGFGSTGEK